jgi:hypothetical protein
MKYLEEALSSYRVEDLTCRPDTRAKVGVCLRVSEQAQRSEW